VGGSSPSLPTTSYIGAAVHAQSAYAGAFFSFRYVASIYGEDASWAACLPNTRGWWHAVAHTGRRRRSSSRRGPTETGGARCRRGQRGFDGTGGGEVRGPRNVAAAVATPRHVRGAG